MKNFYHIIPKAYAGDYSYGCLDSKADISTIFKTHLKGCFCLQVQVIETKSHNTLASLTSIYQATKLKYECITTNPPTNQNVMQYNEYCIAF